jgi:hypothetical protein
MVLSSGSAGYEMPGGAPAPCGAGVFQMSRMDKRNTVLSSEVRVRELLLHGAASEIEHRLAKQYETEGDNDDK